MQSPHPPKVCHYCPVVSHIAMLKRVQIYTGSIKTILLAIRFRQTISPYLYSFISDVHIKRNSGSSLRGSFSDHPHTRSLVSVSHTLSERSPKLGMFRLVVSQLCLPGSETNAVPLRAAYHLRLTSTVECLCFGTLRAV